MSGPWEDFAPAPPTQGAEGPWSDYTKPVHSGPGALGTIADVGSQAVHGFNRGLATVASLPYRGVDWLAERISGGGALPDIETLPGWSRYLNPPRPETTAGRYAQSAGEAVGASALPSAALVRAAPALAALAPTSTPAAVAQTIGANVARAPGAAVAMDTASAATGGLGVQAAQDAGYGPAGQAVAGMAAGMLPGVAMAYRRPSGSQIGSQTSVGTAARRVAEARADAEAADRLGVRQFGPAYNQGPVASVGKQVTETPIVGAPLRNNLDETYFDAARVARETSDAIAPHATHETAGRRVQEGLDRFRDRSFDELDPRSVAALGVNPMAPVPTPQGGGRAQLQRIQQAAPNVQTVTGGTVQTSRGVPVPLPQTRAQRLTARTQLGDLSDPELQRVIRAPAERTSFTARMEALYEKADRGVNFWNPTTAGARNANLLPTANAGAFVRRIVEDEARTGVRAGLQGRYGQMFETLANPHANVTLQTLRAMRTAIGRDLSNMGLYEASLDRSQLRGLYAALSSDIEVGLQDIAARAAISATSGRNNAVTMADARRASQALQDYRTADRYARLGFERTERFLQLARAENPQQVAQRLISAATEGGQGNMRQFRAAMGVLQPEERAEFGALVVRSLGEPIPSARGLVQEAGWSPQSFVTRYQQMSPEARALVFSPQHQRVLDDLFRVANRLANVEALANTSRSASNALNVTATIGSVPPILAGNFALPLTIGGSALATSVLMSRPAYTRWMIGYMQLRANVRAGTDRAVAPLIRHVGALEDMARANPQLGPVLYAVTDEIEQMKGGVNGRPTGR